MIILFAIVVIAFGIWSAIGDAWYWYLLAPALILVASIFLCSSYIQAVTRLYAIVVVPGYKRIRGAVGILVVNGISMLFGGAIAYLVLRNQLRFAFFVGLCLVAATVTAVWDAMFHQAVERERKLALLKREVSDKKRVKR
jgi:hypothetical protein